MIDHKEERLLYHIIEVPRYPDEILLVKRGDVNTNADTVGSITIKDDFEKNLWKEAIKRINEILKSLNESGT